MYFLFCSESGFVCIEVSRKSDSIMSLRLGKLSRNSEEACNQHLFFDNSIQPVIIVSAKHGQRERCPPLVGKYSLLPAADSEKCNNKDDHVTFGCAAGGATEFNVIQNDCSASHASPTTKSSSKSNGQAKKKLPGSAGWL